MLFKTIFILLVVAGILYLLQRSRKNKEAKLAAYQLPAGTELLLHSYVPMYRELSTEEQERFRERMRDFLSRTKVTSVGNVKVSDVDIVFVAAAAIIPLFHYPDWRYNNLDEVLLYSGTFNKQYDIDGPDRNVIGMVGEGAMQREMILSQPALRTGFMFPNDTHNTAIHEFVHLIDKADGATDGIPDYMLDKTEREDWKESMERYISSIKHGHSDINPYGATNDAEFLAVISEYYFKQPEHLKHKHPDLYEHLHKIYDPEEQRS